MTEIYNLFLSSKNYSSKYKKYFKTYEELLKRFKDRDIVFVEIGIQNGGSLEIWQKYFGRNSKIIGIDLNPGCKKFEKDNILIEIGSQSDPNFWKSFFLKYGMVDIILDDGGHTNYQQIITATNSIPYIKDGGMLITEDIHTSYLKRFNNPSKYSFINFVKKTIDDINSLFPEIKKFEFSLNEYVYSIQNFESMAVFFIDRTRCEKNEIKINDGEISNHKDYRDLDAESEFLKKSKIFRNLKKKFLFLRLRKFFR